MKSPFPLFTVGIALFCAPPPLSAHHSTALYDMANPVTIRGVVKSFEWTNPHALIYLNVKDDQGIVKQWTIELMSPSQLKALGWARDIVKPGDVISCTGGRAKNGLPSMLSSSLRLSDGRTIRS